MGFEWSISTLAILDMKLGGVWLRPNHQKRVRPFLSYIVILDCPASRKIGFQVWFFHAVNTDVNWQRSDWYHVWLCMSEQSLSWLIRARGVRLASAGHSKILELFTFQLCPKYLLMIFFPVLTVFSFFVLDFFLLKSPAPLLSWIVCLLL